MKPRVWFALGALLAGLGVALGAFGAHGLRERLSADARGTFEIGVRYQVYHGLAIMAVAAASERWIPAWRWAAGSFAAGTVVFAGSLYALALSGVGAFGAITPIGGVCFLVGWGVLAWSALRSHPSSS